MMPHPRRKRPNILLIVADDLGFSDTQPYGSEISTPAINRLAAEGLAMTGFHTASACSPTRAMLLSGTDHHIAGIGQMAEYMRRMPGVYSNSTSSSGSSSTGGGARPGYEGYLNFRVAALSEILQDEGYLTIMSGKWHLGLEKHHAPCARGFTKNFTFLAGAGNHFNYEPQLDETKKKEEEEEDSPRLPVMSGENLWMEDSRFLNHRTELPDDFYSTTTFTDKFLQFLQNRTSTNGGDDGEDATIPFFGYLAFTAPHWPLQAPREMIEKYAGVYDDGPEALRLRRLQGLIDRGLVPRDVKAAPMVGDMHKEWDAMSDEERADSARRMETYAAMVDVIDQNVQRVVSYLESTGELDNTFILFMSDNGAEGTLLEALPIMRQSPYVVIQRYYNNAVDNIGSRDSFVWYGPRWACAATAPNRGMKTWTTEGGIRCPCIIRYPPLARSCSGTISHEFCTVMDILPTVLELAGVQHPGTSFRGREVILPRGVSWIPYLTTTTDDQDVKIHANGQGSIVGWELFGRRAIRKGKWKAVYIPAPLGTEEWELFDLERDQGETENLAEARPDTLRELLLLYDVYTQETGLYEPDASLLPRRKVLY